MDKATKNLTAYIKNKGIPISAVSRATNISYAALSCRFSRGRALRADEYLAICRFLEADPMQFYTDADSQSA